MIAFREWAAQWGVSDAAVEDWERRIGAARLDPTGGAGLVQSERAVASTLQLEAARAGVLPFRNNVGALRDERGRLIRYGLANESAEQNRLLKSGDYVGIERVVITSRMVGTVMGRFWSREAKRSDWRYTGAGRESAQRAWIDLINSYGGNAAFFNGRDVS